MIRVKTWLIRLSIFVLDKIAFWLLEAKRIQVSKLETDWRKRLSELEMIGCACSLPHQHNGKKHVYSEVSNMFPHLSKRQIYQIMDCRKRLDNVPLRCREWQLILRKMNMEGLKFDGQFLDDFPGFSQ